MNASKDLEGDQEPTLHLATRLDTSVVSVLDLLPLGGGFEASWLPGCHVATVGQLLFAPWALAYSALQL